MDLDIKSIIIYEDENIVVINKPRGLLLQQDGDTSHLSLDNLVSKYLNKTAMPVHRLDKDTSGICVFAKNNQTAE